MKIKIHRGTHEIGGSCVELDSGASRIVLDLGMPLVESDGSRFDAKKMSIASGPNLVETGVLPDISGLYAWDIERSPVDALFLSHAHMDHYGFTNYVRPDVPVYCGAATHELMKITAIFTPFKGIGGQVVVFTNRSPVQCGDFQVTPFLVDHSAFDAYAFVISAQGKQIVYTGDLRAHGNKAEMMKVFLKQLPTNIDVLIIEGTMMSRPAEQVKTEQQIGQDAKTFMSVPGRPIFVVQSATNIDRLVQMYKAAKHSKRLFVMDVYAANVVSKLGSSIPNPHTFKDIRVFYPYYLTQRMFSRPDSDETMLKFSRYRISAEELSNRKDYCMLIRDSMLFDLKKRLGNIEGAGLIYSMWNGYQRSERMQRLLNFASLNNMEVIFLHTSGHADLETIKGIVKNCAPGKIIPVHTEYPERFADIFENVIMVGDGEPISI